MAMAAVVAVANSSTSDMDSAVQRPSDANNCRCTSAAADSDGEVAESLAVIASYTRDIDSCARVSRCVCCRRWHSCRSQSSDPIRYCYRCRRRTRKTMVSAEDLAHRSTSSDGWAAVAVASSDDEHLRQFAAAVLADNTDDIQSESSDACSCSMAERDFCDMDSVAANSYHNSDVSDTRPEARRI